MYRIGFGALFEIFLIYLSNELKGKIICDSLCYGHTVYYFNKNNAFVTGCT